MSNHRNSSHSGLPEKEESKLLLRLLKRIQIITIFVTGMLGGLTRLASRLSRSMKRGTTITALVAAAVLAGHAVSAQVAPTPTPPPSLKTVAVPEPDNIGDFIRNKTAAIALGKSLFWDMQLGSDGIQSCASCHFHAGADNRSKNQINPGQLRVNADGTRNPDTTFNTGGGPNYHLTVADYPFHKLADPNDRLSNVVSDSNDVTSSQGVFKSEFVDVVPGSAQDKVNNQPDPVFNVGGTNVRQVTVRNTPSVINAVFNFRNFWDGSAQNVFNGVNPFGLRDSNAFVLKATNPRRLKDVRVSLNNSSLASQAVGPPLNALETAAENTTVIAPLLIQAPPDTTSPNNSDSTVRVSAATSQNDSDSADLSARPPATDTSGRPPFKRFGRKLGKKLTSLTPLGKQLVHPEDSVLGAYSRAPQLGLRQSYSSLIRTAFRPEWWNSNVIIQIDPKTGNRTFIRRLNRPLGTNEYTLLEYNFSLFFGLAIQAYESTLVSDNTPFDQFQEGNKSALTNQQQTGLTLFLNNACIACHKGPEFTAASVENVVSQGRIVRAPIPGNPVEDTGFFKIGVRPQTDDPGLGGTDPFNNPLSEARLAQQGLFKQLLGVDPPNLTPPLNPSESVVASGAFKAPGLRNVELTAPYFHNGGQLTLEQVVDFYNRGAGDDNPQQAALRQLKLTDQQKEALVAFLKSLTDERVRYQRAPFDHPQLFVPNGHPVDQNSVANDGTGKATDALLEIPAVGRNGGSPLPNFPGT